MIGKSTNKMRKAVAFMLILALMLGMSSTVFGGTLDPGGVTGSGEGTPTDDAKVSITKKLNIGKGVTGPAASFDFVATLTAVSSDKGIVSEPKYSNVKNIFESISFTAGSSSLGYLIENSDNFLPDTTDFPHAGVYTYTVEETKGSVNGVSYSTQEYTMRVYVKNKPDGSGLYIWGVTVIPTDDDGDNDKKVDPTLTDSALGNGFVFENTYVTTTSILVSKAAVGEYADRTKEFEFTITFTLDDSVPLQQTINYDKADINSSNQITMTQKTGSVEFKLKHGEKINFTGVPAGTAYEITEAGATGYTPKATVVKGGVSSTPSPGTSGTEYTVANLLAVQGTNSVAFTNTYGDISPTGFLIDNLPFILLIILVVGALALYIRSRKNNLVRS